MPGNPWVDDPYQTSATARVVACAPLAGVPDRWCLKLEGSIFYPTGGGQPHDTGTIAGVEVVDVRPATDASTGIEHVVTGAVEPGEVSQQIDWGRRFDHMQQHTGQHLLTAVTQDAFGWSTTSFHLGASECAIDLATGAISAEVFGNLESLVNAEIRANRPVVSRHLDPEELQASGVRTRGVPDGVEGPLRVVEIEGVDRNTCGGTHVRSTAELQAIKLLRVSKMHGHARLHFVAGGRVLRLAQAMLDRERALTGLLSAGPGEHETLVRAMQSAAKSDRRTRDLLLAELAGTQVERLAESSEPIVALHREGADMGFLQKVAGGLAKRRPDMIALLTACDPGTTEGVFLIVGRADAVSAGGPGVAEAFAGRGGGRGGRFQGKGRVGEEARRSVALTHLQG